MDETLTTPLNFNDSIPGNLVDEKAAGLDIIFGYFSGLPGDYIEVTMYQKGLGMALMDRGMGQRELDAACRKLWEEVKIAKIDILITKSDLPFDSRWFIIGDIKKMVELADRDKISLPFSKHLHINVLKQLER